MSQDFPYDHPIFNSGKMDFGKPEDFINRIPNDVAERLLQNQIFVLIFTQNQDRKSRVIGVRGIVDSEATQQLSSKRKKRS